MDRQKQIFARIEALAEQRFEQSRQKIEAYCAHSGDQIAAEMLAAFRDAFLQTARLQKEKDKGAARYLLLSHLYSSVFMGGYAVRLDMFDRTLYADFHEIHSYLRFHWLSDFLAEDMEYFKKELLPHFPRLQEYELEQIRCRYVYYYHAAARAILSEALPVLLRLPEAEKISFESEFEVLFGGYMDEATVIWPEPEEKHEDFSA